MKSNMGILAQELYYIVKDIKELELMELNNHDKN